MSGLSWDDIARAKFEYEKLQHNDLLVLTSVLIALQNVELTTQCP